MFIENRYTPDSERTRFACYILEFYLQGSFKIDYYNELFFETTIW